MLRLNIDGELYNIQPASNLLNSSITPANFNICLVHNNVKREISHYNILSTSQHCSVHCNI